MKIVSKTSNGVEEYIFELREATPLENKIVIKAADLITAKMLQEELGFSTSKMNGFLQNNIFPFVKMGKTYVTTRIQLEDWFRKNSGKEIRF